MALESMRCLMQFEKTPGWHLSLTKAFFTIQELSYEIDYESGLLEVCGRMNPKVALKKLNKASRHARIIWIRFGKEANLPLDPNDARVYRSLPYYIYGQGHGGPLNGNGGGGYDKGTAISDQTKNQNGSNVPNNPTSDQKNGNPTPAPAPSQGFSAPKKTPKKGAAKMVRAVKKYVLSVMGYY